MTAGRLAVASVNHRGSVHEYTGCPGGGGRANWRFLTNHSAVLLRIAHDTDVRLADVARDVGLSQRATQMIVRDLVAGGFITRRRVARRNTYEIHTTRHLRRGGCGCRICSTSFRPATGGPPSVAVAARAASRRSSPSPRP